MALNTKTDILLQRLTDAINTMDLAVDSITVNTEGLETLLSDGSGSKAIASGTFPVGRAAAGVDAESDNVTANPVLVGGRYDVSGRTLANTDAGALALNVRGEILSQVTGVVPGHAAASLGKREDDVHANEDLGVMSLVVRKDVAACLAHDGDYQPFQCDTDGTVRVQNTFGTWGTIFVNDTTTVTCAVSGRDFVAIYMLTDTVFDSNANGLSSTTANLYLDDTNVSTDVSSAGGTAIDGITFPKGMTLYGRYTGFTLASGSVIAYVG